MLRENGSHGKTRDEMIRLIKCMGNVTSNGPWNFKHTGLHAGSDPPAPGARSLPPHPALTVSGCGPAYRFNGIPCCRVENKT